MGTLEYLQQPASWLAPGPLIAHAVFAVVVLGVFIAAMQLLPDKASSWFFRRKNAIWVGIVLAMVGLGLFIAFAGPALLSAIIALLSWWVLLGIVALAVLSGGGVILFFWIRNQ